MPGVSQQKRSEPAELNSSTELSHTFELHVLNGIRSVIKTWNFTDG